MRVGEKNMFKFSESFKNVEKDLGYIVSKIMEDEKLLKLLSLQEDRIEKLSTKEKKEILEECIYITPNISLKKDRKPWSYISIVFDNFTPNEGNPEYRDKILYFDIICPIDTWNMGDFKLRPYQIAGCLDVLFDKKPLVGTYTINFLGAEKLTVDTTVCGLMSLYAVTYGVKADGYDEE